MKSSKTTWLQHFPCVWPSACPPTGDPWPSHPRLPGAWPPGLGHEVLWPGQRLPTKVPHVAALHVFVAALLNCTIAQPHPSQVELQQAEELSIMP